MLRRSNTMMFLALAGLIGGTGCMNAEKIKMEMKEKMANRPAELDNLNMWVGTWEGEFECKMMGIEGVMKSKGTSVIQWEPDKRILTERASYEMPDWGSMKGVGAWTYDPDAKKYRMAWVDGVGMIETGTATYCPMSKTWCMKAKNPWGTGSGTIKFTDANTMEWHWVARGPLWIKIMEMNGTTKRKS
jgi:hypothetical protein